jgi:hypothetical protein
LRKSDREALLATAATIGVIEPMGALLNLLQESLAAHHIGGDEGILRCPICAEHAEAIQAAIDAWRDAHAQAMEHIPE